MPRRLEGCKEEVMTWPEIIDSHWNKPVGLLAFWKDRNRKVLLDYCVSHNSTWCEDPEAAINLLNACLYGLGSELIWSDPPKPKEVKPQQPARLDISQISVDQVRKRATELAQAEMQRRDVEQQTTNTSRIDHARKDEQPQEELWKSQYRDSRAKAHRLDIVGSGTQCL